MCKSFVVFIVPAVAAAIMRMVLDVLVLVVGGCGGAVLVLGGSHSVGSCFGHDVGGCEGSLLLP